MVLWLSACGADELGTAQTTEDSTTDVLGDNAPPDSQQDGVVTTCTDLDGDGYGEGCALGFDCNDGADHIYEGAPELCDFIDNNCNGAVDEECPCTDGSSRVCYDGPAGTIGVGRCQAGIQFCSGGVFGDCQEQRTPREELCDGSDNNCDGVTDEGLTNACGLCGAVENELCGDGLDNNCDGVIDEAGAGCLCDDRTNQVCYSGAPHTLGVGVCRGGTFDCVDGAWTACAGEVLPSDEICDGVDNDCDGLVDEGLTNACGACGAATPREVCDGVDNNCNGLLDEGVRLPCGLCSAEGLEEVCGDGSDNDCDGNVDETCACEGDSACYPGSDETRGVGACVEGTRDCDSSGEFWGACVDFVLPQPEVCDGVDNDCDGLVDVTPDGCSLCTRNFEDCDFVDNDCDGLVDEFLRNSCGECLEDVVDEDLCDGLDNDCDGLIDEGLLNACGECGDSCYLQDWSVGGGNLDEGESNGLSDDLSEGLQLGTSAYVYPFLWVANSTANTVSRINTEDPGQPVQTIPVGVSPSRTAVDLDGNVWVANRAIGGQGSVTKIIAENDDGDAERAFDIDIGGNNHVPRGLAVDADNNVWVATYNTPHLYQLRNSDGQILYDTTISAKVYGLSIDSEGILWAASLGDRKLVRFNTNTRTEEGSYPDATHPLPAGVSFSPYGIAVDGEGHVWMGNWTYHNLMEFSMDGGFVLHVAPSSTMNYSRGVAVDDLGRIWVSGWSANRVGRYDPSTNAWVSSPTCSGPIGIGIAGSGTVWTPCFTSNNVSYFDMDAAPLGTIGVGTGPYSYSDMTGFQLRTFTARIGTWTVIYDCGYAVCSFDSVEWDATEAAGSEVQVRARSSVDGVDWSARAGAFRVSPASLASLPDGRFVEVEVTLRGGEDNISPVVRSIDVEWQRP